MPAINPDRLLSDLRYLRSIGAQGTGVVRPAFSETDMQARRWLASQYEAIGLDATIDGVGNVLGRSPKPGKALLIGSHSDTQPTGGWLDGALGVVYGLEVARTLAEDPETRDCAVDPISWQDEESRFYGCLGSRSFCDLLPADALDGLKDKDGVPFDKAVADAGLADAPRLKADRERYLGFLEAHIEQGPTLEDEGRQIGVVETIVGLRGWEFTFTGQQNHAGTTMMKTRRDAAAALYWLANAINEAFPKVAGERSVWTMGRANIHPGAPSIVPGRAELELQFRDRSDAVLDAMEEVVQRLMAELNARGGATVTARPARTRVPPAAMDPDLQEHIARAAEQHAPGMWMPMPSGAFHDAGVVCGTIPAAMLFIPSIGGISHDFAEDSHDEDIVRGCQVLATAAASILKEMQ